MFSKIKRNIEINKKNRMRNKLQKKLMTAQTTEEKSNIIKSILVLDSLNG